MDFLEEYVLLHPGGCMLGCKVNLLIIHYVDHGTRYMEGIIANFVQVMSISHFRAHLSGFRLRAVLPELALDEQAGQDQGRGRL